jgi:hypothetical protein
MQYLLLIYNDDAKMAAATRAEHEAMGKDYREVTGSLIQNGQMRATGTWPSGITTVRVSDGKTLTTDGPFAEAREAVGGFCLIDVADVDAAVKIAERIPGAKFGRVEIRPVTPYPAK